MPIEHHDPRPDDIVIVGGARTPQGRIGGQLAGLTAVDLGAHAVRAALADAELDPAAVDEVIVGQVLQAGAGQNPARQTAVAAGIPLTVSATTINRVCLSGLAAVIDAARHLRLGEARLVVAAGQESMTNAPYLLPGARTGLRFGAATAADAAELDGLIDAFSGQSMGVVTDRDAAAAGIDRVAQDAIAVRSHHRAARAQDAGLFVAEIAPITVRRRRSEVVVDRDEGVRPDSTPEALAALRPAFGGEGGITAGNASPLTDGAAAVIVTTRTEAERRGLAVQAVVSGWAQIAGPDTGLLDKPAQAMRLAAERAGVAIADVEVLEVNEAFAAVVVATAAALETPVERINANGGAIAIGHPIGASGARLALTATRQLQRLAEDGAAHAALIGVCGGGGQGDALLLRSE